MAAGVASDEKWHDAQKKLSAELKRLRKKRGLSLRAMAEKLKITAPYLSDLERGNRNWSAERAKEFLRNLNC